MPNATPGQHLGLMHWQGVQREQYHWHWCTPLNLQQCGWLLTWELTQIDNMAKARKSYELVSSCALELQDGCIACLMS